MRFLALLLMLAGPVAAQEQRSLILASTTSTQNSGLLDFILPKFEAQTGIHVFVVAVGTGQAMRIARNGDADALLVHHRPSEDEFMADGLGAERRDVMYNDFVIVGPVDDPADITHAPNAAGALWLISQSQSRFVSRGDDSGTHLREQSLWQAVDVRPSGAWYLEVGAGMGTALNLASGLDAYTLSDRGTWLSFGNKHNLALLFENDPELFNPYGIIVLNPKRFAHVKYGEATELANWLTAPEGQGAIAAFQIDGQQLFCPVAPPLPGQQNQNITCAANAMSP